MKSLVIGDVHDQTYIVDAIVNQYGSNYEEIIITGDYFDSFGNGAVFAKRTALWLKEKLNDDKFKLIWGNHDLGYRFPRNHQISCSGYSRNKSDEINSILKNEDWGKLLFFYETQGFFISHAGLGQHMAHSIDGFSRRYLKAVLYEDYYNALPSGVYSQMFGVGHARGGPQDRGGITWQDWNQEFSPIDGLSQIVGHTHSDRIQYKNYGGSINVNVDCLPNYVLEIDNGKLKEIKIA